MNKNDIIYPLLEVIEEEMESDYILFGYCIKDGVISIFNPETEEEKVINLKKKDSLLKTSLDKNIPFVENDIKSSFLFNNSIDNPFNFTFKRYGVIPCHYKNINIAILLYQENSNHKKYNKDDFLNVKNQAKDIIKELYKVGFWETIISKKSHNCFNDEDNVDLEDELKQAYSFFASIIHDMRTPINATLGFLDLLEDEVDSKQKEYVIAASQSADMVASLINDVLDISKIRTGNLEIDIHYFSPIDSFRSIAYTFYHVAKQKGVKFSIFIDPNIPFVVKSDPYRLKQIINNFLSNAIKFTPKDGYVDLIFLYEKDRDILKIDIKDTGIGIKSDAIEKIFKPFQQAGKDTSAKFGGTGLGLSISKYLSERLGVSIEVDSKIGEGSTFSISLPCHTIVGTPPSIYVDRDILPIFLIKDENIPCHHIELLSQYFDILEIDYKIISFNELIKMESNTSIYIFSEFNFEQEEFKEFYKNNYKDIILIGSEMIVDKLLEYDKAIILNRPIFPDKLIKKLVKVTDKISSKEVIKKRNISSDSIRVLIVDDNFINRKLMQTVMDKMGVKTLLAEDADMAIDIFSKNRIDIIFIDELMPGSMNGSDAIKKIRELEGGKGVLIYSLTGLDEEEQIKKIKKSGVTDILFKPVKNSILEHIIYEYRDKTSSKDEE